MPDEDAAHFSWLDRYSLVVIHQATGVYMELLGVPAEAAMDHLASAAEAAGHPLVEFSRRVIAVAPTVHESHDEGDDDR